MPEKGLNLLEEENGSWHIKKDFPQKKKAMIEEYKLKKNYKLRNQIKINVKV